MPWIDVNENTLIPPIVDGDFSNVLNNDAILYAGYTPPILHGMAQALTETSTAYVERLKWRIRGNLDARDVKLLAFCTVTGAGGRARFSIGGVASSEVLITGVAWIIMTKSTPATGSQECILEMRAESAGATVTMHAVSCYLDPGAPDDAVMPSGYAPSSWLAADAPVSSERMARLINATGQIAADRPWAIATHASAVNRALIYWAGRYHWAHEGTNPRSVNVGALSLPQSDSILRTCTIDMLTREVVTGDPPEYTITIGAWTWTVTGAGWHSTTVQLPPSDVMLYASIAALSGNVAYIDSLTVWRGEPA